MSYSSPSLIKPLLFLSLTILSVLAVTRGHAIGLAPIPDAISIVSGDNQSALPNSMLAQRLKVKITDSNGNPLLNVPVAWRVSSMPAGALGQSFDSTTQRIISGLIGILVEAFL